MKVRHVDWYADEWLAGTAELDGLERGVYITIVNLIYSRGGPIRNDRRELGRLCNVHGNALARVMRRLLDLGKVEENASEITVKRCENELEKAANRSRKATENGEKGGRPSKQINEVAKPDGFTDEKLTTNYQPSTTNPNVIEIAKAISPSNPRLRDRVFDEDFELWWRAVPRKVGKAAAKSAYAKARRKHGVTAGELLDGIRRYAEETRSNGTAEQYIVHPTTWLNAGRWQDEEGIDNGHARRDVPTREFTQEEIWAACGEGENSVAR